MSLLTLAISKGRICQEALALLQQIGIAPVEDVDKSRKLILETNQPNLRLLIVRATDVPTYVEYGAADLGITGKDVLVEYAGSGLYEVLDLAIAKCRLVVAGLPGVPPLEQRRRMRIATKYIETTRRYYAARGEQVELIKLYGSMELAPLLGLADRIVDLVDTGNTLKANGLVEIEQIMNISSKLIVNKASMKMNSKNIKLFILQLEAVVKH